MSPYPPPHPTTVVARWVFGTALISWRYVWQTTPLHRQEQEGTVADDAPPHLPPDLDDDGLVLADDGVGPMFHRRFRIHIAEARLTDHELITQVVRDFKRFVPTEVVDIEGSRIQGEHLQVGDKLVVRMPGPWDGPVKVVHVDQTSLRLATLRGHLEAGQVQFRSWQHGDALSFEVEAWARPSTPLVHLLYSHLRLAKEIQLNMWVRFCQAAAKIADGHPTDGVHIQTRWVAQNADVQSVSSSTGNLPRSDHR